MPDDAADPAGFVLAACDLREARIKAATPGPYTARPYERGVSALVGGEIFTPDPDLRPIPYATTWADAVHIAAEAAPVHALAEVTLWRLIATKHRAEAGMFPPVCSACAPVIEYDEDTDGETEFLPLAPCELLIAVVAAARAYLIGAGG